MFAASILNFFSNIFLIVSFIALVTSVSLQLSPPAATQTADEHDQVRAEADAQAMQTMLGQDNMVHLAPELTFQPERAPLQQKFDGSAPRPIYASLQIGANVMRDAAEADGFPETPDEEKIELAALPADASVIYERRSEKVCIGGTLCETHCQTEPGGCESRANYVIRLDKPTYISALQLFAHDQIGASWRANLLVKVNGEAIGLKPVYRSGSIISFKVDRVAQLVSIESLHQFRGRIDGGDEAVISDLYLLGHEAR